MIVARTQMKIGKDFALPVPEGIENRREPLAGDFASAMAQARAAQEHATSAAPAPKPPPTEAERLAAAREARAALRQELIEFLEKPLAVHLREAVMKEMGITEADLAAMPPAERLATESMIAQKVRERLLERKDEGEREAAGEPLRGGHEVIASPGLEFSPERLAEILSNSRAMAAAQA